MEKYLQYYNCQEQSKGINTRTYTLVKILIWFCTNLYVKGTLVRIITTLKFN